MKKGKTAVIIIMVLAVAVGAWWFIWGRKKAGNSQEPDTKPNPAPGTPSPVNAKPGASSANSGINPKPAYFLKKGAESKDVKFLQMRLNQKYNSGLEMDSKYGPKTAAAIKKAGFNPDGLFYADYLKLIK